MKRGGCVARIALAVCAALMSAAAQDLSPEQRKLLQPMIEEIRKAKDAKDQARVEALVDGFVESQRLIAAAALPANDTASLRYIAEANRIDKQVGTTNGGPGTTNLITSGSVPRILGFAVESGAITQTVTGTSITFRTNPAGLVQALQTRGLVADQNDVATRHTLDVLQRINVGFTFDTSREKDGRFTGSYRQLQQATAQIYLYNHRDPTHPAWRAVWDDFRGHFVGGALADALNDFGRVLDARADYKLLREDTRARLKAAPSAQVEDLVIGFIVGARGLVPDESAARTAIDAWVEYLRQQKDIYNRVARSPILTLEYALMRPPVQEAPTDVSGSIPVTNHPDLSVIRLVFVRPFIGASEMTANASLSLFNSALPAMRGNIRDWQAGGKLDFPLPPIAGLSKSQLTFAGLFMKLRQQPLGLPVTVNGVQIDRTGNLGFVQARLRIPLAESGFSIPVSLTYATRTELIDEKEIRGNIGLTFDLDKLAAAFRR
jgi:hypothetical protein